MVHDLSFAIMGKLLSYVEFGFLVAVIALGRAFTDYFHLYFHLGNLPAALQKF